MLKRMTKRPPVRANLSGCFPAFSPVSPQQKWSSQDGCLVVCHTSWNTASILFKSIESTEGSG